MMRTSTPLALICSENALSSARTNAISSSMLPELSTAMMMSAGARRFSACAEIASQLSATPTGGTPGVMMGVEPRRLGVPEVPAPARVGLDPFSASARRVSPAEELGDVPALHEASRPNQQEKARHHALRRETTR
jgi:hypothetical protein